ncbi:30S ribosomal protein S4 [subsurface metagenome]
MKIDKTCKICRRLGTKLFLKGEKCLSSKCPFARRSYPPGQHGQKPVRLSEFGTQLKEKQRAQVIFGISENQLRNYLKKASKKKGMTDKVFLQLLEMRLDNVVFRLGFADSRRQARVFIKDGHILINDSRVTTPAYLVKIKDKISIAGKSQKKLPFSEKKEYLKKFKTPTWLKLDKEKFSGEILQIPEKKDMDTLFDEQKVLEYYSR